MSRLVILHTNDMHNRLDESSAEKLTAAKQEHGAVLLDAGDAVWAGNVYFRPGGEPVLDLMSKAGYDAMTVGNREFHFTTTGFKSKLSKATYTLLCANVRSQKDEPPPCQPSLIMEHAGIRVGIVGVTVPMVTPKSKAASMSAYVFDDPVKTACNIASELRTKCDLVIALTHIGISKDRKLAEKSSDIDLIIGGHSHNTLEIPETVNGTPIVQAGSYARHFGMINLEQTDGGWDIEYRLETLKEQQK